jgi:hypothetical protein
MAETLNQAGANNSTFGFSLIGLLKIANSSRIASFLLVMLAKSKETFEVVGVDLQSFFVTVCSLFELTQMFVGDSKLAIDLNCEGVVLNVFLVIEEALLVVRFAGGNLSEGLHG